MKKESAFHIFSKDLTKEKESRNIQNTDLFYMGSAWVAKYYNDNIGNKKDKHKRFVYSLNVHAEICQ